MHSELSWYSGARLTLLLSQTLPCPPEPWASSRHIPSSQRQGGSVTETLQPLGITWESSERGLAHPRTAERDKPENRHLQGTSQRIATSKTWKAPRPGQPGGSRWPRSVAVTPTLGLLTHLPSQRDADENTKKPVPLNRKIKKEINNKLSGIISFSL